MRRKVLLLLCVMVCTHVWCEEIEVKTYPSLKRWALTYYDYDGDGVMEMIGLYDKNNYFALMNDQGVIKQLSLISDFTKTQRLNAPSKVGTRHKAVTRLSGSSGSSGFNVGGNTIPGPQFGILNGNGMLMYSNYLQQSDNEWVNNKQYSGFPVDLDCDGRIDFVSLESGKPITLLQQCDGTFMTIDQVVTQDSALLAEKLANRKSYSGGILSMSTSSALGMSFVVKGGGVSQYSTGISMALDLNGDGRPDLLNSDGSSVLMSLDANTYVEGMFNGQVYPYDLNGDGIQDYLLYSDGVLYTVACTADGKTKEQRLFSNSNIKYFICRDFDHDGDVDPLAFVADGTNSYFVFLRNDGNGTFKKKESYVEGDYYFWDCQDYDADGQYEVMIASYKNKMYQSLIFKIEKDFSLTDVSLALDESLSQKMIDMGDFDNDGYTDFKLVCKSSAQIPGKLTGSWGDKDVPHVTGRYSKQTKRNTAPKKMSRPIVQMDERTGFLRIVWDAGQDAETSVCDLTYDVRIGTEPGKGDVLFAPALIDGRRRVIGDGSQGTMRQMMFNIGKHRPGTYYVAVQAIDAGGLGGAWSDEVAYEHTYTVPTISVSTQSPTTADTITVVASGDYITGMNYRWTATNGEVLSQEQNTAKVIFHAAGNQQISLATQIGEGTICESDALTVCVNPYKKDDNDTGLRLSSAFDINQDGYPDGFYNYKTEKGNRYHYLVLNDGNGNLKRYPKSFNADLSMINPHFVDVNKDGYPDFTGFSEGHNFYINDGEGDFEFQDNEISYVNGYSSINGYSDGEIIYYPKDIYNRQWVDISNTGYLWTMDNYNVWTTSDYASFTCTELFTKKEYPYMIQTIDLNRDGYQDIVYYVSSEEKIIGLLGHNNGDGGFDKLDMLDVSSYTSYDFISSPQWLIRIVDLNNDGYQDIIISDNKNSVLDIYAGQQGMKWQKKCSIDLPIIKGYYFYDESRDFNNDGYIDVCLGTDVLLFSDDWNCEFIEKMLSSENTAPFVSLKDGGYPQMGYPISSTIVNQAPQAPEAVSVKQDKYGLVINWSDAKDDHTPAMQMRYNISVKVKGMEGDGSYVISPMNGGDSKASLVFPYTYKQSTTMTVPMRALQAGQTYEVRVQAIDLWNQHSPMTAPVEIKIVSGGYIEVPELAATGTQVTLRYMGTSASSVTCNPGEGGTVVKNNGNGNFICSWSTPGLKEITIGTLKTQIMIKDAVDVMFSVPEKVYANSALSVPVSAEMASRFGDCGFRVIEKPSKRSQVDIQYASGSNEAIMQFGETGSYVIEAYCEDEILGNTCRQTINVLEPVLVSISSVNVDKETGHYAISWPTDKLSDIVALEIMKEGTSLGSYSKVATANISDGCFVDMTSQPATMSARYKIVSVTNGGQRIESNPHKPLHVMIGQAASGGYNLMWNAYEGLTVDNYKIMRGTTANNLTEIAQVSGSQQSYTDKNAPSGKVFYSIVFTPSEQASGRILVNRASGSKDISSNVISTAEAQPMILATSVKIISQESSPKLTEQNPRLQLQYILSPVYCSCNKVLWSIVSGSDYATISSDGVLTSNMKEGIGTESVKVKVSTLDGSALYDEITIPVTLITPETDRPKDVSGVYYIYNPASGKYLTGANYWGTCASLGEVGVDFLLEKADDNNGVLVDSRYYNNSNHHLGWPILYIDQPAAIWYFYEKENEKVVMTADNKKYLAYDGSSTILDTIPNAEDSRAHWVLMTREDIIAQMAEATKDKPVDVSTLIAYPDFGRSGSKRNTESWIDYPTIGGLSENFCGEKFDCTFDMNQTLTGMPNGHYKLRAQGFYREGADANWTVAPAVELRKNGNEHLYAMLYANEKEKQIMSIFNEAGKNNDGLDTELGLIPNNMSQASSFFSDGLYWNELGVNVTDGTLRIGIKKSVAVSRDWTCFDSFRLYYYGAAFDDDETLIADVSLTHSIPFDVYTVDGRKVRHQVKTIEGLPKGIYLVKGRKVIVK